MTDIEKLIALLWEAIGLRDGICRVTTHRKANEIADYLLAHGVTIPKRGHWIIHSSGSGDYATNWTECSECHVCGSPQWKVCPVCETKMDLEEK